MRRGGRKSATPRRRLPFRAARRSDRPTDRRRAIHSISLEQNVAARRATDVDDEIGPSVAVDVAAQ